MKVKLKFFITEKSYNFLPLLRMSPLFLSIYWAHVAHCDLYLTQVSGSITMVPQSATSAALWTLGGTVMDLNRSFIPRLRGVIGLSVVVVGTSMGKP